MLLSGRHSWPGISSPPRRAHRGQSPEAQQWRQVQHDQNQGCKGPAGTWAPDREGILPWRLCSVHTDRLTSRLCDLTHHSTAERGWVYLYPLQRSKALSNVICKIIRTY